MSLTDLGSWCTYVAFLAALLAAQYTKPQYRWYFWAQAVTYLALFIFDVSYVWFGLSTDTFVHLRRLIFRALYAALHLGIAVQLWQAQRVVPPGVSQPARP